MKKLIVATIMIGVLTLVITACGEENKKPVTLESDNVENIEVEDIEVEDIEVEEIEVEDIEIRHDIWLTDGKQYGVLIPTATPTPTPKYIDDQYLNECEFNGQKNTYTWENNVTSWDDVEETW